MEVANTEIALWCSGARWLIILHGQLQRHGIPMDDSPED